MNESDEIVDDGHMWTWERVARARQQIATLAELGWAAHGTLVTGEVVIEDVQRLIATLKGEES